MECQDGRPIAFLVIFQSFSLFCPQIMERNDTFLESIRSKMTPGEVDVLGHFNNKPFLWRSKYGIQPIYGIFGPSCQLWSTFYTCFVIISAKSFQIPVTQYVNVHQSQKTEKIWKIPNPPLFAHCAQWAVLGGEGGVRDIYQIRAGTTVSNAFICCIGVIYTYNPALDW